ncbi:probable WRKY transcription factor 26 [Macadamia integrifolia]|uniref:probable WRKY transcription factor 26 n=1 Tax=Macadamia integrifolia TaxID=60698 RepID=UPI001C52C955|nr:probable WRKY transcription factor 26 [Macadamia integrifolia]XP_042481673.1 probable WRKY transcription factor 26 [Macadamia integrifolia]
MTDPPPARGPAPLDHDTEKGLREEQVIGNKEANNLVIPEDGHSWKKYGQKFIKNIRKTRSYFKCHKTNCRAKKRAEWSASNPKNIRISYDGAHTHSPSIPQQGSSQEEASASRVNQYDLYTQVFGAQNNSNSQMPLPLQAQDSSLHSNLTTLQ